ncbi:MAG: hypothetical protein HY000_38275 [Planctomycetes bacterium]|nr:hypothetical protein [Planctomycetota bacterium]
MIDFEYLYKGLCGLANAHRANALAGHLGAAVVAGYFFGEDQSNLPNAVHQGIEKELDRIIGGEEAFWFNAKKAGITAPELFRPMPTEQSQPELISGIADALSKNIDQTRESGHNVMFAAIAIRTLRDHPDYVTPAVVNGVRKLIEGFNSAHPGRGYYGMEKGWMYGQQVSLTDDGGFPPYKDEQDMANVVIDELIATASVRKQGFGGLWHIINHAAALTELSRYGHKELARKGLAAHHHHVRLWRSLPDLEAELGPVTKAEHDPRQPVYWEGMLKRDEARLTHRIKTLYGFFSLVGLVDERRRTKAEEGLLYLMA